MNIITEAGALFDNHPRRKNKELLLDIAIVNPCASSNLEAQHGMQENTSSTQSSGRKINIGARSPLPTPFFLSQLIKELAIRLVTYRSDIHLNKSQHLALGTELARLWR